MLSAAPATIRHTIATHSWFVSPITVIPAPQIATMTTTIRPRRETWASHPVVNAATTAPAESAA